MLRVAGVVKRYSARRRRRENDRIALDGVDLDIQAGKTVALLGPNGAGKSTLMRIACGLLRFDAGRVEVCGHAPGSAGARRATGVVFQRTSLDALLTVRENLHLAGTLAGLRGRSVRERAAELADRLGVADRLDDRVGALSGGLARRVDLCRALLGTPDLLLLDEPTGGLDHAGRMDFLDHAADARNRGAGVLLSTHLMDEGERADRVVMLNEGKIVADGTPAALRDGIGDRVVRVEVRDDADRATIDRILGGTSGWALARGSRGGTVVLPLGSPGERPELDRLASAGLSFSVGGATLGDVYLHMTGRTLGGGGAS